MKTSYIIVAVVVVLIVIGAGVYLLYPTGSIGVTSITPTSTTVAPLTPFNATVIVSNTKSTSGNYTFNFTVAGVVENTTTVTLASKTNQSITFTNLNFASAGKYTITAGSKSTSITVTIPIFADVRVRQAFNYAFDDASYIATVLKGGAIQPNGPVPKGMNGYNPNIPYYTYNLTMAKELLLAAGVDDGFNASNPLTIPLYYNEGNTAREDGCLLLASAINSLDVGLNVQVSSLSWPQYVSAEESGKLPLFFLGWAPDYVDADDYLVPFLSSTRGIYPYSTGWSDTTVNQLVDEQSTISNTTQRQAVLTEIYNLVYNDSPYIWTDQPVGIHFQSASIQGYYFNPALPGFDFANMTNTNSTTITYETIGSYQYLDPATDYETSGGEIISPNTYETLMYFNGTDSSSVIPWLASDMNISADGMTYTFDLRQNITFADGTPFNASCVVFSLERAIIMTDPATPSWMLGPIKGAAALMSDLLAGTANQSEINAWVATNPIEALSNYQVAIHLDYPYSPLPLVLAFSVCSIVSPTYVDANGGVNFATTGNPSGNHNTIMDTTAQAGTGPYIMNAALSTPEYVILQPNPNYWGGPTGTRHATDTIVIKVVTTAGTLLLDLESGNCQLADISRDNWYSLINQTLWVNNGTVQSIFPGIAAYGPNPTFDLDFFGFNVRF